jgi:type II pantothenate kinase
MFKLHGPVNTKINQAGKIDNSLKPMQHFFSLGRQIYPYLLVNLRSGASFIRVDAPDNYKRVAGTSIGVSLAWGISRYLSIFKDPSDLCESALKGDSSKIDMSVGDIYGGEYKGLGMPSNMIASSFGKLKDLDNCDQISKDDVARSLLTLIAANNLIFSKIIA